MLGLYIYTLTIGHKFCKSIINKLTLQKELIFFVTNHVFWTKSKNTTTLAGTWNCARDLLHTNRMRKAWSHRTNVVVAFLKSARQCAQNREHTGIALAVHRWSRRCCSVGVTVASGSERWSRKDTSIPTLNQCSSPQWIAASTPDTVPAIPCPLE